jgi:hypothetical protein
MIQLKPISKEGIPRALEKVERYRLLNEPAEAESICRDILEIDPDNQEALIMFILTLTDQFNKGVTGREAYALIPRIKDDFKREYYRGIVRERQARAALDRSIPGSNHDAYEWLEDAMEAFEKADQLSASDNDDAILRWNTCARIVNKHNLTPRPPEERSLHLPLE